MDLAPSKALSILRNGPPSFRGRKVGALISDGVDAAMLSALCAALEKEGATLRLVAPQVGGVKAADGSWIEANEKIDGAPSVLFDAVALLVSEAGTTLLADESAARDFVADAFAHLKFIAWSSAAAPLFTSAGVKYEADPGCIEVTGQRGIAMFVEACAQLRCWARASKVKQIQADA